MKSRDKLTKEEAGQMAEADYREYGEKEALAEKVRKASTVAKKLFELVDDARVEARRQSDNLSQSERARRAKLDDTWKDSEYQPEDSVSESLSDVRTELDISHLGGANKILNNTTHSLNESVQKKIDENRAHKDEHLDLYIQAALEEAKKDGAEINPASHA